jgi:hypothetical protein
MIEAMATEEESDQLEFRYGFVPVMLQMRKEVLGALAVIRDSADQSWQAAEQLASAIDALDENCAQLAARCTPLDARVRQEAQAALDHALQWRGVLTGYAEVLTVQASRGGEAAASVAARFALHETLPAPDVGSFF